MDLNIPITGYIGKILWKAANFYYFYKLFPKSILLLTLSKIQLPKSSRFF